MEINNQIEIVMGTSLLGKAHKPECLGLCFQKEGTYITPTNTIFTDYKRNFNKSS